MRLNAAGQVTYGVGAGVVSVNQTAIGQGGSAAWPSNTQVAYGRTVNGKEAAVSLYDTITKKTTDIASMPGGASQVAAGGGLTARYLADGTTGTTSTNGFKCSTCGLHDVGPDGVLYYKQGSRGITARTLAGVQTIISVTAQVLSLRGAQGGCVWTEGDLKARTWKLPAVNTGTLKCYSPRAAQINGEWWLAYGDGTRILAQPFGQPVGYVVANLGNTFDLDCVALNGKLRVAYATTQGEQTGQYRVVDLDLSKPRVPLTGVPPDPNPEPPMAYPDCLPTVKAARAKYANESGPERAGLICNYVAWVHRADGAGTFYKPSGDNWNQRSLDVIIFKHRSDVPAGKGATFDCLKDAEGDAVPQWSRTEPSGYGDESKWRAATDPGDVPEPPDPQPPDPSNAKARLQAVNVQLANCIEEINSVINDL